MRWWGGGAGGSAAGVEAGAVDGLGVGGVYRGGGGDVGLDSGEWEHERRGDDPGRAGLHLELLVQELEAGGAASSPAGWLRTTTGPGESGGRGREKSSARSESISGI